MDVLKRVDMQAVSSFIGWPMFICNTIYWHLAQWYVYHWYCLFICMYL